MTQHAATALPNLVHIGDASNYLEEIHAVLGPLPVFEDFSAGEISTLCDYMECYAASTGAVMLNEGDDGDFMMLVLTGRVQVVKQSPHSGEKIVSEVGPGGFLGEMSLLDGMPRFASCVALAPTDVAVLHRSDLVGIVDGHPVAGSKVLLLLLQLLTRRLRSATTQMLLTTESNLV
jgi:CRP/FNR family transcriptional regulator, cyclic AMP receptor protein